MNRIRSYFVPVGLLAALALAWLQPAPASAFGRKIIIMWPVDSIESVAVLGRNGRQVEVTIGGPAVEVMGSTSISATVVVFQEQSGALGAATWRSPRADVDEVDEGETRLFAVDVNAIGKRGFEAGPAIACYFAEERVGGKLVRKWSRCEEILIVEED